MGTITQEKDLEMLQKLPDGNFKKYNPLTKSTNVKMTSGNTLEQDFASHKADNVVHVTTIEKLAWSGKQDALPAENKRKITYGTAIPTTLAEGEIYFQYE